jgi:dTDP-4-amino-4,6-dideoxygalactose transaminase
MQVPFVDLRAQYLAIKPELDAAIQGVIDSCAFVGGDEVKAFEREFAAYCAAGEATGQPTNGSLAEAASLAGQGEPAPSTLSSLSLLATS